MLPSLQFGLNAIASYCPHLAIEKDVHIQFIYEAKKERQLKVIRHKNTVQIHFVEKVDAFRGLMLYWAHSQDKKRDFTLDEFCPHRMNGCMLDVSRGAVNTVDSIKRTLVQYALLGLNMLMLYTEDTYEVSGEPFFGYKRGRYTKKELREIDDFAFRLGVEVIPCIQTLGHFEQILQWPVYHSLRDTDSILMAGEKKTLQFIEKMIQNMASVFRSKRIHLGMDEAIGIGAGFYRDRYGAKEPFEILSMHLKKVEAICKKHKLESMIWSDMFFRLGSKTGDYYDPKSRIPDYAIQQIPANMSLVYWDYYHTAEAEYQQFIRIHRQTKRNVMVATGIWTWNRFWTAMPFTATALGACMRACRKEKVEEVFATLWRDDGAEIMEESVLPGYIFYAESCFTSEPSEEKMRKIFRQVFQGDWDAHMRANDLDYVNKAGLTKFHNPNTSKMLLWQDPLLGHLEGELKGLSLSSYYKELARQLNSYVRRGKTYQMFRLPAKLAEVLTIKADLHQKLKKAFQQNKKVYVQKELLKEIRQLQVLVKSLLEIHRLEWLKHYKPFGFEILENRYGGLISRILYLEKVVKKWLKDGVMPEEMQGVTPPIHTKRFGRTFTHRRCMSPARLWTGFNY